MTLSKPKLFQTLALLISFIASLFLNKVHSQHSTSFRVDVWDPKSSFLTYDGDAHVPPDVTNFLRLTRTDAAGNPQSGSVGRVLYNKPVQFWEEGKKIIFEATIKFVITPPADDDPADGIVFFIAPLDFTFPQGSIATGGNLGIFGPSGNSSGVFAVEFDTCVNSGWDPSYRHFGIDIESRRSVITRPFSDDFLGKEVTLRINYYEDSRWIIARASVGRRTYLVDYIFDLKNILDREVQVGIAASTGADVALHDVHAWYISSTLRWDSHIKKNNHTYIRHYV